MRICMGAYKIRRNVLPKRNRNVLFIVEIGSVTQFNREMILGN